LKRLIKLLMNVVLSDPVLIAESSFFNETGVDRWGLYQFPQLSRLLDGRIAVTFHINADSATAYGKAALEPNRGVSSDGGVTWARVESSDPVSGLLLPNAERLLVGDPAVTPPALKISGYALPRERGTVIGSYGQQPYVCYRHDELPAELQGVPSARMPKGANTWNMERARLDDPEMLRYSTEGVFPVTCWGDVHLTSDNALVTVVYPCRIEGENFRHIHSACLKVTISDTFILPAIDQMIAGTRGRCRVDCFIDRMRQLILRQRNAMDLRSQPVHCCQMGKWWRYCARPMGTVMDLSISVVPQMEAVTGALRE